VRPDRGLSLRRVAAGGIGAASVSTTPDDAVASSTELKALWRQGQLERPISQHAETGVEAWLEFLKWQRV
jgi:hypothetical protein